MLFEPHADTINNIKRIATLPGVSFITMDPTGASAREGGLDVASGCCAVISVLDYQVPCPTASTAQQFQVETCAALGNNIVIQNPQQVVRDTNQWLYHQALAYCVPQFVMVGTIYSKKHAHMLATFEAWEQSILHIRAHYELAPTSPSRPRFTVLDLAPTFEEIEHQLVRLVAQAVHAQSNPQVTIPPTWSTLGDGLLKQVNPLGGQDLGRLVVAVVGNRDWLDRRDSVGGNMCYTWMSISLACFQSLGLQPSYDIQPQWVHTIATYGLWLAAQLGVRGAAQGFQDNTVLQLRSVVDARGAVSVGQGDVMAHIARAGVHLALKNGLKRDGMVRLLNKEPLQSRSWTRATALIVALCTVFMLVDMFLY